MCDWDDMRSEKMQNHIHFIAENVGADLRVCPDHCESMNESTDEKNYESTGESTGDKNYEKKGEHVGSPLPSIVQWFKTMTTNQYIRGVKQHGWVRFDKRVWQRNYWEHIVRNENELLRIAEYIRNNPQKWIDDKLNGGSGNVVMEDKEPYGNEVWMA